MLKIRLSMIGAKKRPIYKIVIADSRFPRDGRFIEKVGLFNPLLPKEKKERIKIEAERIKQRDGIEGEEATRDQEEHKKPFGLDEKWSKAK